MPKYLIKINKHYNFHFQGPQTQKWARYLFAFRGKGRLNPLLFCQYYGIPVIFTKMATWTMLKDDVFNGSPVLHSDHNVSTLWRRTMNTYTDIVRKQKTL